MAADPVFATTPRIMAVAISTANANRDGTGTIGTVGTGVAAGTRISRVRVKATVTTTAGTVRLYLYDGSTYYLFDEWPVPAITASASVPAFQDERSYQELVLPSASWSLRASTEKAEAFNVVAFGADL